VSRVAGVEIGRQRILLPAGPAPALPIPLTPALSDPATTRILPDVNLLGRIIVDPAICHGKPVVRGLRYPVESMLEYLAAGDSIDDLLAEFPDLERDDLLACLQYAATAVKLKTLHVPTAA
jgi:uncharacterized protein (DUF433 family)